MDITHNIIMSKHYSFGNTSSTGSIYDCSNVTLFYITYSFIQLLTAGFIGKIQQFRPIPSIPDIIKCKYICDLCGCSFTYIIYFFKYLIILNKNQFNISIVKYVAVIIFAVIRIERSEEH